MDGSLGHFAIHLEAGSRLPVAEQDTPEVRSTTIRATHSCPNLRVVLAVQYLKALRIIHQDVKGLSWTHVLGLAAHKPTGNLGKSCGLDATGWGKCVSET